jgi:RimJ/RimL family protein N-acetyltransferase
LELSDASFIYELLNSPLFIKNIGDRNIRSESDAEIFLTDRIISSYQNNGYGLYAVVLKDTGQVIGMSGLVCRENLPNADIGFAFLPDFIGKGYAYEASKEVMEYAKNTLALDPILGITIKENEPSIKLLNKLGLIHERLIDWDGEEILLLSTSP